jgi:hypothetical protein
MIAFVSKSEADCRTLREVGGLAAQSVVSCADLQEARRAISWHGPKIVICERESWKWQELLEETQAAESLMMVGPLDRDCLIARERFHPVAVIGFRRRDRSPSRPDHPRKAISARSLPCHAHQYRFLPDNAPR